MNRLCVLIALVGSLVGWIPSAEGVQVAPIDLPSYQPAICADDQTYVDVRVTDFRGECSNARLVLLHNGTLMPPSAFHLVDQAGDSVPAGTRYFPEDTAVRVFLEQYTTIHLPNGASYDNPSLSICGAFEVRAYCGAHTGMKTFFRDCQRPALGTAYLDAVEIEGKHWAQANVRLHPLDYTDDSMGHARVLRSVALLDRDTIVGPSRGSSVYLTDLSEGQHEVQLFLMDICEEHDAASSQVLHFNVDARPPNISFVRARQESNRIWIFGRIQDPGSIDSRSGVQSVEIFHHDLPGEFSPGVKLGDAVLFDHDRQFGFSIFLDVEGRQHLVLLATDYAGNQQRRDVVTGWTYNFGE